MFIRTCSRFLAVSKQLGLMLRRPTLSNNFRHLTVKLMANIQFETNFGQFSIDWKPGADSGFLRGEGAKGMMTLYGMEMSDF